MAPEPFDAVLLVSFGGPEGPDDVMPFLDNVLAGKQVPEARKLAVAEHYHHFGGVSPINAANRQLRADLRQALQQRGTPMPVYWGNRNWTPYLPDVVREMQADGVRRAVAVVTSALSSHSSCRRYLEDIDAARAALGTDAPDIVPVRRFFNHPLFVASAAHGLRDALTALQGAAHVVFTAHSIPLSMSEQCDYAAQFREASSLVAQAVSASSWSIAYQSRSGPPSQPWLGPDVLDELTRLRAEGHARVAICPVGFVSDHMEVVWDLDVEAQRKADALGLTMARAKTAGMHADFVTMICELIEEQTQGASPRALGVLGPRPTPCAPGCCPPPTRPAHGGG